MRAREGFVSREDLDSSLDRLINLLEEGNINAFKLGLSRLVVGYAPSDLDSAA